MRVEGQGGNIQIKTTGFFVSFDSVIEASSEFGVDGKVRVNTFDAEYNSDLVHLPNKLVDPSLYLTQGCGLKNNHSLVNLGRGGLVESPFNAVANSIFIPDIKVSENTRTAIITSNQKSQRSNATYVDNYIVEAEDWKVNQQGNIELIGVTPRHNLTDRVSCAASKQ